MSKVICDVCGTTYPETAAQCPICGCAKDSASQTSAATSGQDSGESSSSYSYVRGGRFSEKNVRRRNSGNRSGERRRPSTSQASSGSSNNRRRQPKEEEQSNLGLIIIVIVLLIAIIAVVIHLATRYLGSDNTPDDGTGTSQSTTPSDTEKPTDPQKVPCTELEISNKTMVLVSAGSTWTLEARPTPANTTDAVTFTSADPTIATVDENGVITAVGPGEVTITVTCGTMSQTCQITCNFGTGTVDPTDPAGEFDFEFNSRYFQEATGKWEVTLMKAGETWRCYKNDLEIAPELITWVSDDPSVCTIENGIVTAVGVGKTEIHAQYNGVTYTCEVICRFS